MIVPETYPSGYASYVDFLFDYNDSLLLYEPFVPFWIKTLMDCSDVVGTETTSDLEGIKELMRSGASYSDYHRISSSVLEQLEARERPKYMHPDDPIGLKYQMILNILHGTAPEAFDYETWFRNLIFALDQLFLEIEDNSEFVDARVKRALRDYEPQNG